MAQYNSTAQQSRGNLEGIPAGISKYSQCNNQVHITLESCLSVGYLMLLNTFKNPSVKGSMPLNGTYLQEVGQTFVFPQQKKGFSQVNRM